MIEDVVDALAVARVTRLIVEDRIPFGKARDAILARASENEGGLGSGSRLAELVTCPWCMSMWVAAGVLVLRRTRLWRRLAPILAASEVAGLLNDR